jgi:uncharacterized YccA/Bax inhibitor family protein
MSIKLLILQKNLESLFQMRIPISHMQSEIEWVTMGRFLETIGLYFPLIAMYLSTAIKVKKNIDTIKLTLVVAVAILHMVSPKSHSFCAIGNVST